MEKNILYLCRRECCPQAYYDGENRKIEIIDDDGNKVSIKIEDFAKIVEAFKEQFPNSPQDIITI